MPFALIERFLLGIGFLTALRISVVADFGGWGLTFFALLRGFLGVGAFAATTGALAAGDLGDLFGAVAASDFVALDFL